MKCPKCLYDTPGEATYCGMCYFPFNKSEKIRTEPSQPSFPKNSFLANQSNAKIGKIIPACFFLVGLFILGWSVNSVKKSKAAESWPKTEGKVLFNEVQRKRGSKGKTTYSGYVQYSFWANNREMTSDQISFGEYSSSNRHHAENVVARYPVGSVVSVSYNPLDPSMSVLEPGKIGGIWIGIAVGLGFTGFPLLFFWAQSKNRAKKSPWDPAVQIS